MDDQLQLLSWLGWHFGFPTDITPIHFSQEKKVIGSIQPKTHVYRIYCHVLYSVWSYEKDDPTGIVMDLHTVVAVSLEWLFLNGSNWLFLGGGSKSLKKARVGVVPALPAPPTSIRLLLSYKHTHLYASTNNLFSRSIYCPLPSHFWQLESLKKLNLHISPTEYVPHIPARCPSMVMAGPLVRAREQKD